MRKLAAMLIPLLLACGGDGDDVNVLLIIVDTLRADRIGCYGARNVETPNIDRLAKHGVRFDAAFTQAPFTLPSITSILTSLYPYRHQVRNNQTNLDDSFHTLAEHFQRAGYRTAAVLGSAVLDSDRNLTQGFEWYDDNFPREVEVYNELLRAAGVPLGDRAQRRASDVTDRAWTWLAEQNGAPFFMMVHYFDPHSKYDPPPPFKEKYGNRRYDGEVAYTDYEIGRLLDSLRSRGIDKNTLVVLVSDHGEALGEHSEPEHGFFVYESTIRIPMILSLPGTLPKGSVETALVGAIDLFPTITELAGIGTPGSVDGHSVDGRSLGPLMRGEQLEARPVYSEAFLGYFGYGWSPTRAIRTRTWKLVDAPRPELYDMTRDPGETQNLYDLQRDESRRLEAVLAQHYDAEQSVMPVDATTGRIGEAQRKRLEALGYITKGERSARAAFGKLTDPKDGVIAFRKRQQSKNYTTRASAMLAGGNGEHAILALREAIVLDTNNLSARFMLGEAVLQRGGHEEAVEIFAELAKRKPRYVRYRAGLGAALAGANRPTEAVAQFEECARLAPANPLFPRLVAAGRNAITTGSGFAVEYPFDL